MMEQADSCEAHCHIVLVASLDDMVIADRTARLCHIFHTALVCSFDVISEWEECIGAKCHICILIDLHMVQNFPPSS